MLRTKMLLLIKKSILESIKLEDYSNVYYKIRVADKYTEGGVFTNYQPNFDYLISYPDNLEFFRIYNEALLTEERFNNIEIHFDNEMNQTVSFTWDQSYYDADIEGNKKFKKKES